MFNNIWTASMVALKLLPVPALEDKWVNYTGTSCSRSTRLCFFLGACWPSLRRPEGAQLLLGGWGLHLQVLRGDSDRHLPQGHQTQPRHPMDHKGCAQAQRDARPDICRKEEPRPGQGPQVPSDHRRLPPCCLEEAQHPAAAPLSLEHANCLYIQKINILFMVTVLSRV